MGKLTFRGGIHPYEGKELSKDHPIEKYLPKGDLVYPLSQHIGAPSVPCVKKGDTVLAGQKIADAGGFVSVPLHASVSGTVKGIEKRLNATGSMVDCIVIENDQQYQETEFQEARLEDLTKEEILNRIKEGGVVGMGGAGFPTHVKLAPKDPSKIEYILVNGAECEPYITSDYRRMIEEPEKVVKGLQVILTLFDSAKGYICIEDNKPDCIAKMKELVKDIDRIEVKEMMTKYPQGGERMLIEVLTGRRLNSKMLPLDVGCIVDNVATVLAIRDAIKYDRPLISTVMTLTGDGLNTPCNVEVPVGTDFQFIVESRGGLKENVEKIISGGPMMGISLISLHIPAVKTSSSILAFTHDEVALNMPTACIRCGRCIDACPSHLIPQKLYQASLKNDINTFIQLNGMECIECGCCSYVCPAKRNMTQAIRKCKSTVTSLKRK